MLSYYNLEKLESAMYDFNKATGVSITLFDTEKQPITTRGMGSSEYCKYIAATKTGKHSCRRSNNEIMNECKRTKKITKHLCKAGLLDIAIPLLHRNEIVGYLMIGQIRQDEKMPFCPFEPEREVIENIYNKLPLYDEEKINSIINIATMLTRYIMFENMLKPTQAKSSTFIADYVDSHLTERITINELAKAVHMSKSGIYKCMRQSYGCTLGEFICSRRVERSLSLLEELELSISEVSDAVGFSDAAYFSRCFKRVKGVSPIKYRSALKSEQ